MNHESYQQQISQLVDNELGESHEQELFVHLGSCKECRNFLKSSWQMQSDIQSGKPGRSSLSIADEGAMRSRWVQDKRPVVFPTAQKRSRVSFRTFALALFVVVLGCVMMSSTVTINESAMAGSRPVQTNTVNGVH